MKTLNPNDLGKKFLVEECQKISMNFFSRQAKQKAKKVFLTSQIEAMDKKIELITSNVHFGGVRYWFKCPLCAKKVGTLFIHPLTQQIGCRACLRLEYRSRKYKGMLENNK
jgi:hypothetical protein